MKEILIKLRQENRYSQSLLSKVLGISRQAYMKYESGEVEPSVEIVRKLSKIYQVPYDVIIDNGKSLSEKKVVYSCNANINADVSIQYFQNQLDYLQEVITDMKNKLSTFSLAKKSVEKNASYSKSRSFNKDEFFKKVGKLNIDGSYVNELRENSLT